MKPMFRLAITLAAVCAMAAGGARAARADTSPAALDSIARRAMAAGLTPGMALAVVEGDRIAWKAGYGDADREHGRRVTPTTRFYIASTSKALTALAAARLAAHGDLDLDAPLSRALAGARFPEGYAPDSFTVRDLLTHTHGIDGNGPISLRVAITGEYTNALLLDLLSDHHLAKHGRAFAYSNLGYDLIGIVMAPSETGGWKRVVEREVIQPLGMSATTSWRSRVPDGEIAWPYEIGPDGFERIPLAKEDANMGPAGGHFSTATDLARFLVAELNGGRLDGRQAIEPGVVAETQRMQATQDRNFAFYHRFGWGLGWDLGTYEGDTLLHRFGSFAGYWSHVSFMPAHKMGVVVLANGGDAAGEVADVVATAIYDRALGRADWRERMDERLSKGVATMAEAREEIAAGRAERAARSQQLPRPLTDYTGVFESPQLGTLALRLEGGHLTAALGVARGPVEVYDGAKNQLRAEIAGRGMVIELRFDGARGPADAARFMNAEFTRRAR